MTTIDTRYRMAEGHASEVSASKVKISLTLSVLTWLHTALDRRRSRLALLEMSDEQLKDIGLSRADAYREGHIPLWN